MSSLLLSFREFKFLPVFHNKDPIQLRGRCRLYRLLLRDVLFQKNVYILCVTAAVVPLNIYFLASTPMEVPHTNNNSKSVSEAYVDSLHH